MQLFLSNSSGGVPLGGRVLVAEELSDKGSFKGSFKGSNLSLHELGLQKASSSSPSKSESNKVSTNRLFFNTMKV